ncbi:DUF4349 domain-containing protein [Zhouia spongiae]|uniref:DUF4349 domain-containing protein n=1 Tax=Zhouia spongiae TaxID=2202721 RepID=A0ABY3YQE6_9FLAO|nr:DUF4349 domain-containing protein [Zhouia spongiae]UNY99911.1 DUF4349 domain-containing protein [Zhouia spongiae]
MNTSLNKNTAVRYGTKYFALLLLCIITSCSQNQEGANIEMAADEVMASPSEQRAAVAVERKLIKEGRVEFETGDISSARKSIFKAVETYEAYVSSDQEFKYSGRRSNTVVIRVPATNFDDLLKDATHGVDKFDSKEINVRDVTEEFLDVQARLKTKKELEGRYLELIKQAKNVTEILEIERQTGQLRSDIESIEGRLKYLENKVSFATLTITFYETIPDKIAFGQKFKSGFKSGWENLIWFFVALTNVWPFILLAIGLLIGIRIYRKKRK